MKQLLNGITVGDARVLSDQIEDESCDIVLCDPVANFRELWRM